MYDRGLSPFTDGKETYPALEGCVPATMGRRFGARALDVVLGTATGLLINLPLRLITASQSYLVGALVVQVLVVLLTIGVYIYFGMTGFLPGGRILGVRQVRVSDGSAPGWSGLAKYLLIGLVSGFSFGIGYLITIGMIKRPLNRGWHDVATGIVVLDVKAGRDPIAHPWTRASEILKPVAPREAVVSVGASVPDSPLRVTSTDETSLVSPLAAPSSQTFTPVERTSTPQLGAVTSVVDDGMILGVPWRKEQAGPFEPANAPLIAVRDAMPAASQDIDMEDRTVVSLNAIVGTPARGTVALVSDDGQRIPIDKVTVVGRNPVAPEGYSDPRLHSIPDTTMSVSKTHAVVGPDPDGVWVQDLRSTNGTAITTANGMRTAVPAGGRAVAGLGAVVHIGKVAFKVAEQ